VQCRHQRIYTSSNLGFTDSLTVSAHGSQTASIVTREREVCKRESQHGLLLTRALMIKMSGAGLFWALTNTSISVSYK